MAAANFNTENRTYRQLLGNGLTYRIPRFQRDYSWGEEEWEDLWVDIQSTLPADGEPAHYMGYLVLQTDDNRIYEVIDGQQRLTTISLIVLASMRLLNRFADEGKAPDENRRRLDQLRATYVGYLDPVTLTTRNKLSLNRNNDSYYRDYLVTLADHLPQRGFPASTHAMRKAFEWFERRLREQVKNAGDPGMALAQFVETLSDKLFFTVITVADQLNAYKVFETLNARGVRLSATDLLKNYLFSVLARGDQAAHEMDELERRWEGMVGRLGGESFPDFLRMHWNSRKGFARQTELFKVIRNSVQTREVVFDLLREMDEDIDTYLALTQPDGSSWSLAWKQSAQELRMFSVRQPYPMLLAAKRNLSNADFGDLLRATVVIAFRYNVIGAQHTGEQERVYHAAAMRLHGREATTFEQVLDTLKQVYPGDDAFKTDFTEKSIKTTQSRNAKIVRYILCSLERQAGGIDFDADSPAYTIEHVLPQSPEAGWEAFNDRDLDLFVYRLANMVMLETGMNRAIGNQPYADKRPVLLRSNMLLTKRLAEENADWIPERLNARQKRLAALATSVWRIAQIA
ncbi:MAG: DUF262 domain-containing HNH endonuclease family protein [Castellaniella sp.]|uniref:DUF262 domain-containing protein n=1 Tax=Castellaniella sp. TaxID=1955812 RepID=UPI002A36A2C3|nr:DUF262 domain-containing HNH endonuclease family protein [Castellaniella sp.]MDY0308530.1 DUF262 domain-containing HNH endonuclease family protein [Castellaniella sp.]